MNRQYSNSTAKAISEAERKFGQDLPAAIHAVMASERPEGSFAFLGYRADWTREDEAAMLVRRAMGSDFNHQHAKAIVREILA